MRGGWEGRAGGGFISIEQYRVPSTWYLVKPRGNHDNWSHFCTRPERLAVLRARRCRGDGHWLGGCGRQRSAFYCAAGADGVHAAGAAAAALAVAMGRDGGS